LVAAIISVPNGRQVLLPIIRMPLMRMRSPLQRAFGHCDCGRDFRVPCVPPVRWSAHLNEAHRPGMRISILRGERRDSFQARQFFTCPTMSQTSLSRSRQGLTRRRPHRRARAGRRRTSWPWDGSAPVSPGRRRRPRRHFAGRQNVDHAAGADHARAEDGHGDVIRPEIGPQHRLVLANPARHEARPHAVLAHVAKRHRFDRGVRTGYHHSTSRARIIAGLSGLSTLSQSRDGAER
jgi:hypothetical protein